MYINLEQIPIYVISCADQEERRNHMRLQLSQLNISFAYIEGIRCDPGFIGVSLSHLKVLSLPDLKPPFLILEDDCSFPTI